MKSVTVTIFRFLTALFVAITLSSCTSIALKSPAVLSPFGDGTQWLVVEDMEFEVKLDDKSIRKIVVPRGFVTDLASTPRVVWSMYPPFGKYLTAAILHDYLYWRQTCRRDEADKIIYQTMRDAKVDEITQSGFYLILRSELAGGDAWNTNRKERIESQLVRVIPEQNLAKRTPVTNWGQYRAQLQLERVVEKFPQPEEELKSVCHALGNEISVRTNLVAILMGI